MNIKGYHNKYANLNENNQIDISVIPDLSAEKMKYGTVSKNILPELFYSDLHIDNDVDFGGYCLKTTGSIMARNLPIQIHLTYDAGNQEYHHYLFEDSFGQSIYSRATYKIINSKLTLIDIYNVDIYELSPYVEYILPDPENPEQDIKMYLEVIGNTSEPTIRGTIIPIIPSTVTNIINSFASSTTWNFGVIDFSYAHCIIDSSSFSSANTSGTIDVSSYTYRQLRKDGLIDTDSQRYLSSNNKITIRIKN